jgi:hypothetical protein
MVGVALVPISVGGWGLRELAVTFSVCFRLVGVIGVLPGLIVRLLYPLPPAAAGSARTVSVIGAYSRHSSICCGRLCGSRVPLTSITKPRPLLSRRLISGQPAAR